MPFEAGLACALRWAHRNHSVYLLEAERFRLQHTLSDLNGTDPYIHGGTGDGVILRVLGMFRRPHRNVSVAEARAVVSRLRLAARGIRQQWGGLLEPGAFQELAFAASTIAEAARRAQSRR